MKCLALLNLTFTLLAVVPNSPAEQSLYVTNRFGMVFRFIPSGEFVMGSPESEQGRHDDETQRRVVMSNSFYLSILEITRKEWKQVMGYTGQDGELLLPVSRVSYKDALTFCEKLSGGEDGREYRLPSEEEWEYACRANSALAFGGSGNINEMGWTYADIGRFSEVESVDELASVGARKLPNAWGLYDMHGNVKEWTSSLLYENGSKADPLKALPKPTGPKRKCRVVRGGSLVTEPAFSRAAFRDWESEDTTATDIGFRVVMELPARADRKNE